ncbi:MAG: methyltransferase family protein [Syntrophobacteraceae bacterium]
MSFSLAHRFILSHVTIYIVVFSDIMILFAYILFFPVFTQNIYASSIIEIRKDQRVISTGPYAVVRHPMYLGAIIMLLFTPLALGSFCGLIPFFLMFYFIILRLLNEEEILLKGLPGYKEYCGKIRHRLIPFIW